MTNPIMDHFEWGHLPPHLALVSGHVGSLAKEMNMAFPDSAEKTAGLRKLLEAKDCFVRCAVADRKATEAAAPEAPAAPPLIEAAGEKTADPEDALTGVIVTPPLIEIPEAATTMGDLLTGADEIAAFMYGTSMMARRVYDLSSRSTDGFPSFKIGRDLCARKSSIHAWIAGLEAKKAAAKQKA